MPTQYSLRIISFTNKTDQNLRQSIYDVLRYYVEDIHQQKRQVSLNRRQDIQQIVSCIEQAPNRSAIEATIGLIINQILVPRPFLFFRYFARESRLKVLIKTTLDNHRLRQEIVVKNSEISRLQARLESQQTMLTEAHQSELNRMRNSHTALIQELRDQMRSLANETQALRQENENIKQYLSQLHKPDSIKVARSP